jgi:hypothetical protein
MQAPRGARKQYVRSAAASAGGVDSALGLGRGGPAALNLLDPRHFFFYFFFGVCVRYVLMLVLFVIISFILTNT